MTNQATEPTQPEFIQAESAQTTVMGDFIFGGIEADERQLLQDERNLWTGLRHFHAIEPLDPEPDQPVQVTVFVGPDVNVDQITMYVTVDQSDPAGHRGAAANGFAVALQQVEVRWEALIWGYVEIWQAEIPAQPENTFVQYRIEGWRSTDPASSLWSREANLDRTFEHPTLYGYSVDRLTVPRWAHEAIIYQIFVDRFTGVENRWLAPTELNEFTGGTLRGVIEHVDYIANLGVTAIWLSPIFQTPTYHGYDTSDYYTIDPRFGTNEDLRELVTAAHARSLRVILDFVANHTSTEFAPFVEACKNPEHSYSQWYRFDENYQHGYQAFFDVASMPQLNTDNPAVQRFLMDAATYWLKEYDIDGYRLDYAAGPSHAFWSKFRVVCRQVKADCWLFGEVTLAGDRLRTYMGRLDGCLDFAFARRVRQLCGGAQADITLGQFATEIERSRKFFRQTPMNPNQRGSENGNPDDRSLALPNFILPSFLDNHDMNRFLWLTGNDQSRLQLAAGLMFELGGPPILYYGTEVGLSQPRPKGPWREESRHPMLWGAGQDQALVVYFQKLIALRKHHFALIYGDMQTLFLDETSRIWVFMRVFGQDRVVIAVNLGKSAKIMQWPTHLFSPDRVVSGLDRSDAEMLVDGVEQSFFMDRIVSVEVGIEGRLTCRLTDSTLDSSENYDRIMLHGVSLVVGIVRS